MNSQNMHTQADKRTNNIHGRVLISTDMCAYICLEYSFFNNSGTIDCAVNFVCYLLVSPTRA